MSVDDSMRRTIAEQHDAIDQLKAENAKLREQGARLLDKTLELGTENAKLRELVRDYFNAPCFECNPLAEGWEGCKHCESGNCTLAVRTLELEIEVDG